MSSPNTQSRTFVYVDGFNLYHRAVRRTPHKWLDLVALADYVLGSRHTVAMVRYFTARIIATPRDPAAPQRQQVYLDALAADPRLTIHLGQFRPREKTGPIKRPPQWAGTFATIATFEEKGSDVNMAAWALADAYEGRADTVVLLTNDSDLAEPARILQARGTPVGVIVPAAGLKPNTVPADFTKTLRPHDLARCQLLDPRTAPWRTNPPEAPSLVSGPKTSERPPKGALHRTAEAIRGVPTHSTAQCAARHASAAPDPT